MLGGERAESIPESTLDPSIRQVERQLQRWGIRETRVPPGTLIRFRQPSAWTRYKIYIRRERVEQAGGMVPICSKPGAGVELEVSVPLQPRKATEDDAM